MMVSKTMMKMNMTMKMVVMMVKVMRVMMMVTLMMLMMVVTLMTSHPQGFWLNWFGVAFRHQCYFKAPQMTLMYSQD